MVAFVPLTRALVFVTLALPAAAPSPRELFQKGLRLFDDARAFRTEHPTQREESRQRFREAANTFRLAGQSSTAALTNAANSYYFAGDLGEAVLHYRRALAVDPDNERARSGLEAIRRTLPIRPEPSGTSSLLQTLFFWHQAPLSWRLLGFEIGYVAFWSLSILTLLGIRWRRTVVTLGILVAVPTLGLLASLVADGWADDIHRDVVVLVQVQGRTGNGTSYSSSHSAPFPAGTEASVLETRSASDGDWLRVHLPNDETSWIPASVAHRVIPQK